MSGAPPIVDVEGLTVDFRGGAKPLRAVGGVDLTLRAGEVLALLGESGSGKSVTLRALMRLTGKQRSGQDGPTSDFERGRPGE
jgi:peptide/nickel transport system ATP-binding protein